MITIAIGHGIQHLYLQAFLMFLPLIKADLMLTPVQSSLLVTSRNFLGGTLNFPLGVISDVLYKHWRVILAGTTIWAGTSYLLLGLAPNYMLILLCCSLIGVSSMAWHHPAISTLSQRIKDQRGLAISIHATGASTGESLAPILIGFLLVLVSWRTLSHYAILPCIVLGVIVWWLLPGVQGIKRDTAEGNSFLLAVNHFIRSKVLLGLMGVMALQSAGRFGLLTFFTIYLKEDLLYDTPAIGLHLTLITILGMGSAPILGVLSDKLGRKPVLSTALFMGALGAYLLAITADGWQFTLSVAFLGLTFYAVTGISIAAAMDAAPAGSEGTTIGVLFTGGSLSSILSPIITGLLVSASGSNSTAFYYGAVCIMLSCVLSLIIPLPKKVSQSNLSPTRPSERSK